MMKRWTVAASFLCLSVGCQGQTEAEAPLPPKITLWAWHGPQDLEWIDPAYVSVAYLARTVTVSPDGLLVEPRRARLVVPPETELLGVIRVELRGQVSPQEAAAQLTALTEQAQIVAREPHLTGIQIDFDAPRSFRPFYHHLVSSFRRHLPPHLILSITALSSWCLGDRWLQDMDVDEVVPMAFSMGPQNDEIIDTITMSGGFADPLCTRSVGIAVGQPVPRTPDARMFYVFSATTWNKTLFSHAMEQSRRAHGH